MRIKMICTCRGYNRESTGFNKPGNKKSTVFENFTQIIKKAKNI